MQSVSPLGRFIKFIYIVGRRAIGGFSILRRSAKCTRRPNLKAAMIPFLITRRLWPSCHFDYGGKETLGVFSKNNMLPLLYSALGCWVWITNSCRKHGRYRNVLRLSPHFTSEKVLLNSQKQPVARSPVMTYRPQEDPMKH